jgi:hypothetical protein
MHPRDEAQLLRQDATDREAAETRADQPGSRGAPCVVAKTKTVTTYPTAAARFYACEAQTVTGAETEGGSGALTAGGDTFFALNLGSAIPPSGTTILCTLASYRWVFRYD